MNDTRRWFWLGLALETALLPLAWLVARVAGVPLHLPAEGGLRAAALGAIAALPPFALLVLGWRGRWRVLASIRSLLEHQVCPCFQGWHWTRLLAVSIAAGFAEECLFRGAVQAALTRGLGPVPGLLLASLVFGVAHPLNRPYLALATGMGAYFGTLWWASGHLLAPIVAHAAYDFAALLFLLRGPRAAR